MSDSIIKVSNSNSEEAYYELNTSNPKHLNKIITHINDTITYLSGVPGASVITSTISRIPALLQDEINRYTTFASNFKGFYETIPTVDAYIVSQINDLFEVNYVSKSIEEINSFVDNYISGNITIEYQKLMEELGLSIEDTADLIYINGLINALEGLTNKEALEIINGEIGTVGETSLAYKLLNSLKNQLVGDPLAVIDNANSLFSSQISAAIGAFAEHMYGKTVSQNNINAAMESIKKLTTKLAIVNSELAANPYIKPGGRTYARRDAILKHLAENEAFYNSLSAEKKAAIDAAVKNATKAIEYTMYGVLIAVEGYKSLVVEGKDWDDTIQDMVASAPGIIGAGILGGAVTGAIEGSTAGPVGVIAGVLVGVGYDVLLKPIVKERIEEVSDWWDEFCW